MTGPTTPVTTPVPVKRGRSPTQLWISARARRLTETVLFVNRGASNVYVGNRSVAVATGNPLTPFMNIAVDANQDWYAIADPTAIDDPTIYVTPGGLNATVGSNELASIIAAAIAQAGAPPIDKPALLGFGFPVLLNAGASATVGPLDMTLYNSYFSWYGFDAVVSNFLRVTLTWRDSTTATVDKDEFIFNGQGAGTPTVPGGGFARGPVRGSSLTITFKNEGGVAANFNYDFNGSLRTVPSVRAIEDGATNNVLFQGQIAPGGGAGVNTTVWLPLFSGVINVGIQGIGAAGQAERIVMRTPILNSTIFDRTYTNGTTPDDFGMTFIAPRGPLNLLVTNQGASALNGFRVIITGEERA